MEAHLCAGQLIQWIKGSLCQPDDLRSGPETHNKVAGECCLTHTVQASQCPLPPYIQHKQVFLKGEHLSLCNLSVSILASDSWNKRQP